MNECLNCGKDVIQKEGRRKRLYCSDTCRVKFNRQKHGKKTRWVSVEKYNEVLELLKKNKHQTASTEPISATDGGKTVTVKLTPESLTKHPLWKEGDPPEGTSAFFMLYDAYSYKRLELLKSNKS